MGVIKRLNQLKVSRQIRKMANEIQVLREVRNIDNEYEDLVKSATEDEEKKNIRAKVEYYKSIYGSPVGNADYEENFSLTLMPS